MKDTGEKLKFIHRFGSGVVCELEVDAQPPDDPSKYLEFVWTGRPKKKHVPEYRQWTLCSLQILVDRWQKSLTYVLGVSPRQTEFWFFKPGQTPKLVEKIRL